MLTAIPQPVFREDGIWFVPTVADKLVGVDYNTYVLCRADDEDATDADPAADWYCFEYGEMYDPVVYSAFQYLTCTLEDAIEFCEHFISNFQTDQSNIPSQA